MNKVEGVDLQVARIQSELKPLFTYDNAATAEVEKAVEKLLVYDVMKHTEIDLLNNYLEPSISSFNKLIFREFVLWKVEPQRIWKIGT